MARFFIDRPIFAWVIAIIIMLAGVLSLSQLPISRYPDIAPPSVTIGATYPGASAQAVENSVTQVIEQAMTGLDGMDYMSSTSDSNGSVSVTLTFSTGTDPDIAQVQVQNKLQVATPLLPQIVQQQGLRVNKASSGFLQVIGFVSEDGSMGRQDISDYVSTNIVDPLSRVEGVGSVQVFGGKYAMRIWLDPGKLNTYRLAPSDIVASIRAQNAQVAVGQLGGTPAIDGQQINATITSQDRLQTPEQFRAIVLRSNADGSVLKLGDVARVELGSENYSVISRYNGQPASGLAVSLATGANALQHRARHRGLARAELPSFPSGLKRVVAIRLHALRACLDQGGGQDPAGSHRAGVPGHVPLPAELARHADPDHRGAGGAARHLRRAGSPSASRSTRSPCSPWCWRSACWSTMPSWWWRTSSA
jgi:hydrophobe/amphiphile efflux-1 (HAE1) family protein